MSRVARYIAGQEEHHRVLTFADELREFVRRHGMQWREERAEQAVETAGVQSAPRPPG